MAKFYVNRHHDRTMQVWDGHMIVSNGQQYYACVFNHMTGYYIGIPLGWNKAQGWFPIVGHTLRIETFDIDNK